MKETAKDKLIVKQQLEIESLKHTIARNQEVKKDLHSLLYNIGAPLNDNKLKFNKEQLTWCAKIAFLQGSINIL